MSIDINMHAYTRRCMSTPTYMYIYWYKAHTLIYGKTCLNPPIDMGIFITVYTYVYYDIDTHTFILTYTYVFRSINIHTYVCYYV